MAFNNNSRYDRPRSGGGFKPRFESRDRGPAEMHKAVCDSCRRECEVPFRPTSGKPVFCRDCFKREDNGGSSRSYEQRGPERSGERQMFDSVCADCGDTCKVPFQPNGDKPVFCSNCFGDKKQPVASRDSSGEQTSNPALKDKIEAIDAKLDRILNLLIPAAAELGAEELVEIEVEPVIKAKKKSPVKKSDAVKKQ